MKWSLIFFIFCLSCTAKVVVPSIEVIQPVKVDTVYSHVVDTVYSVYTRGVVEQVYAENPPDGYRILGVEEDMIEFYYPSGVVYYKYYPARWKKIVKPVK
jgi:hypothetical protein